MKTFLILLVLAAIINLYFKAKKRVAEKAATSSRHVTDYNSLDDWRDDLTTLWSGKPHIIEFSYFSSKEEKTKRKAEINRVTEGGNGKIYLQGYCHMRNETRTFDINRITSDIVEEGSSYTDFKWLSEKLGLNIKSK